MRQSKYLYILWLLALCVLLVQFIRKLVFVLLEFSLELVLSNFNRQNISISIFFLMFCLWHLENRIFVHLPVNLKNTLKQRHSTLWRNTSTTILMIYCKCSFTVHKCLMYFNCKCLIVCLSEVKCFLKYTLMCQLLG